LYSLYSLHKMEANILLLCIIGLVAFVHCDKHAIKLVSQRRQLASFPSFSPTVSSTNNCATENKRSMSCGAKAGKNNCCPGLLCHNYQSWRCVKEENKYCAGSNTFSTECGSSYKGAPPECCPGLACKQKRCQEYCAVENERSVGCGAKAGAMKCCPGLVCHEYQTWRCVKEEKAECAGPNTYSKYCGSKWKQAPAKCCSDLICKGFKCMSIITSANPSIMPSSKPSLMQSDKPSAVLSSKPSFQPSAVPSSKPSFKPSSKPSLQLSSQPTFKTSEYPSVESQYPSVESQYPSVESQYPSVESQYPSVESQNITNITIF